MLFSRHCWNNNNEGNCFSSSVDSHEHTFRSFHSLSPFNIGKITAILTTQGSERPKVSFFLVLEDVQNCRSSFFESTPLPKMELALKGGRTLLFNDQFSSADVFLNSRNPLQGRKQNEEEANMLLDTTNNQKINKIQLDRFAPSLEFNNASIKPLQTVTEASWEEKKKK